ncbi:hypothetical protein D3C81_1444080 [compost metagenome]
MAIGIDGAHRQHFGVAHVQRREDLGVHLQRGVGVIEGQHEVAPTLTQGMHRITNVGGYQTGRDVQPVVAQLGNPTWEKPRRQGVRRRHLDDLALATFKVVQMAQNFAQLVDNGARCDEK